MSDIVSQPAPSDSTIVGVGASAGGLEAFSQLLRQVPSGTELSFVLITQLDSAAPGAVCNALVRVTAMPVADAEQGVRVEPGHVYVITANTELTIHQGCLVSSPAPQPVRAVHTGIDVFLRSLAVDRGRRAIGVLLSGLASDGIDGLRAIRAAGGNTFAQTPSEAKFSDLPQRAIDAGVVDSSMSVSELAVELLKLSQHRKIPSHELRRNVEVAEAELERVTAEAEQARAEAERANAVRDDFLATLSHELKTPLSSMLLNAQRLREGGIIDQADLKRVGDSLERAVHQQSELIDDLLDMSRVAAGKLSVECCALDLCDLARSSVESLRSQLDAKQLDIKLSLQPGLDLVWADPARTRQVVTNLLSNAIKFTPALGQITLTIDAANGSARVRMTDTGIGISPEFLPHLFSHFAQSDRSITRAHGGLGLGLALVKHLVELQGGRVQASSPGLDRGATFTATFPFASSADTVGGDAAAPLRSLDRPGKTKQYQPLVDVRVLFIDDDLRTREAVSEVLELTGARVALAASTADGMLALETFKPQVIVCDIAMPGEDGYAFIRKLRAREIGQAAKTPVLALTALASVDDKRRALAAGFQLHLAKPIDIDHLRDSVLGLVNLIARAPSDAPT